MARSGEKALMNSLPLAAVALAIILPLFREYREFRREWGFRPFGALLTALTLFPALGVGTAVALPLGATPALQWAVTFVATVGAYSLATAAVRPSAAPQRSS
jgi:hypothetical protein